MRRPALSAALALIAALVIVAGSAPTALAGAANGGLPGAPAGDPLAGLPWGTYSGPLDEVFPAYRAAAGGDRLLLGRVALAPRVRWFGAWYPDGGVRTVIGQYIADVTGGNPGVLAQAAVFRMVPWEREACRRLPTAAEQAGYGRWIRAFAAGIGSARMALILQPDLPFAQCVPGHSTLPLALVAQAARTFSGLAHTTVYIDAGAADWLSASRAALLLRRAGIAAVRGFALDATHYDATAHEIAYGAAIVRALARAGVPGRHFVINTAANGRPFTYQQYHGPDFDNATVCATARSSRCVTLGIPPTTEVAAARWGLPGRARRLARRLVDAYLWIGRPWLVNQSDPFDLQRTLALAATTPF